MSDTQRLISIANPNIEPLPPGANFIRGKMLWELGLGVASDPAIKYGGNRDLRISVGSGGGDTWRPSLNFATGSAILAHDVGRGAIDMAFVNPSALLTQAHRGVGLFDKALPVRVVWCYPSRDSFAIVVHPRTGLKTVRDIKTARYPLKMSVREDPTHSTLVLIEQLFNLEGFTIADVLSWGGELVTTGSPFGPNRMGPLQSGALDAVFDEALVAWLDVALGQGYQFLDFDPGTIEAMIALGWRKSRIQPGDYANVVRAYDCLDFGGWPLYCNAALDEKDVIEVCKATVARQDQMPWTKGDFRNIAQIFSDSLETPLDVPLHSGAEKFVRDILPSL